MVRRASAALALFLLAVSIGSVFRSPARAGGPQSFRLLVETEPLRPMGVAVDETGRKAYVALFGVDHLVEVDLATQSLNWRVSLAQPTNVAIDGDEIYVLTFGNRVEAIHRRTQNSRRVERAEVPASIRDILFNALPPWFVAPDANGQPGGSY